jgi:copper chaperone CopZ
MSSLFSGKGVKKVDIDLKGQRVVVEVDGNLITGEQLLETINKTGKAASYLGAK